MRKLDKKLPRKLQKSLSDVICRIKSQSPNLHIASSTSKFINGCRHPKSFHLYAAGNILRRRKSNLSEPQGSETAASESAAGVGRSDKAVEATLEDIDRFLFENFRSLYCDDDESNGEEEEEEEEDEEEEPETPGTVDTSERSFKTPDLTPGDLCDSRRFFVSPTSSGSLIEEARISRVQSDEAACISSTITAASAARPKADPKMKSALPSEDCVAVLKASADPCEDFRRSMEEVMEARARHGQTVDWGFMEELLFCYLRLNEKKHYRFVLDAFVDSVVDMRRSSSSGTGAGGGAVTEEEVGHKETLMKGKERKKNIDNFLN